jgi:hypothetical protein
VKTRLFLVSLLALLGCAQSGNPPATQLSGTNSAVVVNVAQAQGLLASQSSSLLFVTSTNSNELRVLDLAPVRQGLPRDFVRAPNPIRPLSIPTIPSPVEMTTPTRYGPLGQPLNGNWIFARGAGGSAISIVGAVKCPQQLRQLGTLEPRPDSVVTALASRLSLEDTQATLYLTTFDGQQSTLWEADFPNVPLDRAKAFDPTTCPKYPSSIQQVDANTPHASLTGGQYTLKPLALIDGVVTSMLALPTAVTLPGAERGCSAPDCEDRRLVVATRLLSPPPSNAGVMTEQGRVFVMDPQAQPPVDPMSPFQNLVFNPGATIPFSYPVKRMVTHGNVVDVIVDSNLPAGVDAGINPDGTITGGHGNVAMDAGTRVFAILDEASCGGQIDCTGVLAIDLDRPAPDGGLYFAVAVDGEDNLRGTVLPDGGADLFGDTYWRPPYPGDAGFAESNRMLPLRFGSGVIQDVAIQSSGFVQYFSGAQLQYGLLGVATISGIGGTALVPSQLFVFDAMTLRVLNVAPQAAIISNQKAVLPGGVQAIFDGGPENIHIEPGIWPNSETIVVQYEGIVAGLQFQPLDAGLADPNQGIWPVDVNGVNLVQTFVEPGDLVVPVDSTGTECLYAFPILPDGQDGGVLLSDAGIAYIVTRAAPLASTLDGGGIFVLPDGGSPNLADNCPDPIAYSIRSSGLSAKPLTVTGNYTGYIGRVALPPDGGLSQFVAGADSTPTFRRFWRPSSAAGTYASTLTDAGMQFNLIFVEFVLQGGDEPLLRGSGYVFDVANGFVPGSIPIDQTSLGISGFNLPGAATLYQPAVYPVVGADRFFVLYPSGNSILDFSPATSLPNYPNSADIGVHY